MSRMKFMKGKNFSTNNTGKRKKSDFYETPYSITRHLLRAEPFNYHCSVCEPACGAGAIVSVLSEHWHSSLITAYDADVNFLSDTQSYHTIITNPPFSLAFEFIQHAKHCAIDKFAMLLPLSYLHGKQRYDHIYTDTQYPLKTVYVFTRYPLLGEPLRADGKYHTGMMVYAWYVFERRHRGAATIGWLDNHKDVLTKDDASVRDTVR